MTRIVAGTARGRRLKVPPGQTRPTSDRVREALFSTVSAWFGGFDGLRVLDLYAGSGALGLEALSRGAGHVLLVESDTRAARTIRANIERTGLPGAEVAASAVERELASPPAQAYDLVVADPPYAVAAAKVESVLESLVSGWLTTDSLVVVERDRRGASLTWPHGLVAERERRYGETMLWYGHPAA